MPNRAADKIRFATAHWPENFRPSQTSLARANSAGGVRPSFFLNDSRQSTNFFPTKEDGFTEGIRERESPRFPFLFCGRDKGGQEWTRNDAKIA